MIRLVANGQVFFLVLVTLVGTLTHGEAASAFVGVPKRLGYWRFNSEDLRSEAGHKPLDSANVGITQGVHESAVRIPLSPGPAWLRFAGVESDGSRNLDPNQGAIRFLYRPVWLYDSPARALPISTSRWTTKPPGELRLLEIGYHSERGWAPRMALSIDASGTELVLQTFAANGQASTNFVTDYTWSLTKPAGQGKELVGDWCEIAINYTPTNCALIVDGALKQDKRTQGWGGPGITAFSGSERGLVIAIGGSLDGSLTAQGLIDEFEIFDQPIGPLRNYSFASRYAASADIISAPPRVTLHWVSSNGKPVTIRRRVAGEPNWTVLSTNATGMVFVDDSSTLRRGGVYEYEIDQRTLFVSIDAPPVENRGRVIVLVDRTVAAPLKQSLDDWTADLVGDGWEVIRHEVPRHDDRAWDQNSVNKRYIDDVAHIKSLIAADYRAAPDRTKAVVLVGHVTVPLSGFGAEDGHLNTRGAWPADAFYGDMDGDWQDISINQQSQNPQLRNVPRDGKFDPNFFDPHLVPSEPRGRGGIELAVGRIDFSRMPAFQPLTEVDLLKRYFAKNHRYRHSNALPAQGVVAAGLFFSLYHAQSQIIDANAAWLGSRLFGVHSDTVFTGDIFASPGSCLVGMQGGYGAYDAINNSPDSNRALGVNRISTPDLARPENEPAVWFYVLKGSFFANWNLGDNCFMRAVLATPNYGLGALFTMDTVWRFESAAVGEPLAAGLVSTAQGRQSVRTTYYLGDPTLRLLMIQPPKNLVARQLGRQVSLSWTASPATGATYAVYRSNTGIAGPFVRLTPGPITATEFTDNDAPTGRKTYMVRALALTTTGSGTFTNISQGVFATVR